MKIVDYETNKQLTDVAITLSREEAEDLILYLRRLTSEPQVDRVFLTNLDGGLIERELTLVRVA